MTKTASAPELMTAAEYARHRKAHGLSGVSGNAVRKAIDTGRLSDSVSRIDNGHWRIDAELADKEWAQYTTAEKSDVERMPSATGDKGGRPFRDGREKEIADPEDVPESAGTSGKLLFGQPDEPDPPIPEKAVDPAQAEAVAARRALLQATSELRLFDSRLKQLKYLREAGELVDRQAVQDEQLRIWKRVRDRILGIPARVDAEFAATADPDLINDRLSDELTLALEELAR